MNVCGLHDELDLAITLALEAGECLRNEFCRPGGPRGSGGHAPIDTEVEMEIRARLSAAFPGYGYLGEETGSATDVMSASTEDAGPPIWIVDPNDGTSAFQEGYRGASVSIALVSRHDRAPAGERRAGPVRHSG